MNKQILTSQHTHRRILPSELLLTLNFLLLTLYQLPSTIYQLPTFPIDKVLSEKEMCGKNGTRFEVKKKKLAGGSEKPPVGCFNQVFNRRQGHVMRCGPVPTHNCNGESTLLLCVWWVCHSVGKRDYSADGCNSLLIRVMQANQRVSSVSQNLMISKSMGGRI